MRRTIQDLVASIDPNVKILPEVEEVNRPSLDLQQPWSHFLQLLLEIADEFIDSVANFSCRLSKHRGGDTLEARDLQLHLGKLKS
jgi:transcription initiation factor TFIID subunit 12